MGQESYPASPHPPPGRPDASPGNHSPPVLVVENSRVARQLLEDHLRQYGYTVVTADTVAGAVRALDAHRPGLVLANRHLADGDAWAALVEPLRDHEPRAPLIAVLAADSLEDGLAAIDAGATDCLFKPIRQFELITRVVAALRAVPRRSDAAGVPGGEATAPEHPSPGVAINDAHASAERIASVVQDLEIQFRERLSDELREPLRQTRRFAETLGSHLDSAEVRASLNVLHGFLEATRRLISRPDRQDVSVHAAHTDRAQTHADGEVAGRRRQTPNPPHFPTENGLQGHIRRPNFLQ